MANHNDNIPMVSISVLAYNHEKYIRKALDSILMQKVNFLYEIVIGEDCSQDGTRDILMEYKAKYPDKIKLILNEKNLGMMENAKNVRSNCMGKYRAGCEGDDYWTDPYKLQKQIDFLENNPQFIGTVHKVEIVDEDGNPKAGFNMDMYCKDRIYTLKHAEKGIMPGQTASRVYRNILINDSTAFEALNKCKANGDIKLSLYLALNGDIYCFDEVMSHHRWVTEGGDSWSARTKNKNLNLYRFNSYIELSNLARQLKGVEMDYTAQYLGCGLGAFTALIMKPNIENLRIFTEIFWKYNRKIEMCLFIFKKCITFPFRRAKRAFQSLKGHEVA
ncbi:glycosyltransferase [Lutispora sp.]|uniref:glycosyltransferase n=1 Tax=Lutispora sp. TaxID=2828727 RepID=UPI00356501F6